MLKIDMKFVLSRLLLIFGSLVFTMVLLEIGLRLFLPQLVIWDASIAWEPIDGVGWQKKPNLDIIVNTGEGDVHLITDANGHRIGTTTPDTSGINILAVGDSFVEALQVDYDQTMTAIIEQNLTEELNMSVNVVNTGVGAWGTNQYRIKIAQELEKSEYDFVLLFLTVGNDLTRESVDWFPPTTALTPPDFSIEQTFAENSAVFRVLTYAKLRQHSHLYRFVENSMGVINARSGDNNAFLPNHILISEADDPMWETTMTILADIDQMGAALDIPVLVITLPTYHYMDDQRLNDLALSLNLNPEDLDWQQPARILSQEFNEVELDLVDVSPEMREAYAEGNTELFGRIDRHFSPAGHQVVAEFLTPIILEKLTAPPVE